MRRHRRRRAVCEAPLGLAPSGGVVETCVIRLPQGFPEKMDRLWSIDNAVPHLRGARMAPVDDVPTW